MSVFCDSINLWASSRGRIEAFSKNLISVAKITEQQSSQKQLMRMEKVTGWTKIFVAVYYYDIIVVIILFAVFSFYQGKLVADIPVLLDNHLFYWIFWVLESIIFSVGSKTYFSFMSYHIEVCIFLVHLYDSLGEKFESSASWEDIRTCLDIHHQLIDVTKMFEVLFSRSLFGLIAVGCVVIISSTAVILVSEYPEPLIVLILVTVLAVHLAPNYLGDIIAVSYERVGLSVYRSPWIEVSFSTRRVLSLITMTS